MNCYECGHQIKRDLARYCDHCGSSLEIKPKQTSIKKEVVRIENEIDQAANLFLLWNSAIAAAFIFYIIHAVTDGYLYLFLLVLFMLVVSWILLLTKLHDLASKHKQTTKQFMLMNFGLPIIGTFYSFIKLTQK
jgi:DNA-directed RNA polymerase subunit RPC12/RpoP